MMSAHPGTYPVEWDTVQFEDLYARRDTLPVEQWVGFVAHVRKMRYESTCPIIRWPSWVADVQLHDLILGEHSLDAATRMLYEGRLPQDTFDAFHDVFDALRVEHPTWETWASRAHPSAVGPVAACQIARLLSYIARGVL